MAFQAICIPRRRGGVPFGIVQACGPCLVVCFSKDGKLFYRPFQSWKIPPVPHRQQRGISKDFMG